MPNKIENVAALSHQCLSCFQQRDKSDDLFGWHRDCFKAVFEASELTHFAKLKTNFQDSWDDSVRNSQFQGAYPKYSFSIGNKSYIAKVGKSDKYPLLPLGEYACNRIARLCGLNLSPFHLFRHRERPCFVTENFISQTRPQNLVHMIQYWPKQPNGDRTAYDVKSLIQIVEGLTNNRDTTAIVHMVLFDYLVGNDDRHRSNIAFIQDARSLTLSPIYDNVTELATEPEGFIDPQMHYHPSLKMNCSNATGLTNIQAYVDDIVEAGYQRAVTDFVSKVISQKTAILDAIDLVPLTPNFRSAFYKLVSSRLLEISNLDPSI